MTFPTEFNATKYVKWHNSKKPADSDLAAKAETLRNGLMKSAQKDLIFLEELFSHFIKVSKQEYKKDKKTSVEFKSPLATALKNTKGPDYSNLFKSTSSIINKLWRKNKEKVTNRQSNFVTLSNIRTEVTDLIRTEIVGDTLDACEFLSSHFDESHIYDVALQKKYKKLIKKITVESEMKMSAGYFAYHILIHFTDNIIVEVQIYSAIMKKWRMLSHVLYDVVRLSPIKDHEFNAKESRLISLGHLFHLAECEIKRLQDELSKLAPTH